MTLDEAIGIVDGWHHVCIPNSRSQEARKYAFSKLGKSVLNGEPLRKLGYRLTPWTWDDGHIIFDTDYGLGCSRSDIVPFEGSWEMSRVRDSIIDRIFFFKNEKDAVFFKLLYG